MDGRMTLAESIVQAISVIVNRNKPAPPETDTSIETRTKQGADKGFQTGGAEAYKWYMDAITMAGKRRGKYSEYEQMDIEVIEVASALDIYADNATNGDRDDAEVITIRSESTKVVEILEEIKATLNLDADMWSIARELAKNGDCFEEVVADATKELVRLKHLPPGQCFVETDEYGRRDPEYPYRQKDENNEEIAKFEDWQILHFRLRTDRNTEYGVNGSILYKLRKVYKQLSMMEDAIVISRLVRAQQRYAYLIDVEGIEPGEPTLEYLNEVKQAMKKRRTIDPQTGKMDLKYNPMTAEEDIYVATRQGSQADVKVLQGSSNLGQLQDIEYFSKKMFAGLKVPKAWMGFEGETRARAVITELDVQFARTVRRLQQALIEGLEKLFTTALALRGVDPAANPFEVELPILSTVDELRKWQIEVLKASIANVYRNQLSVSTEWVYSNLLGLTDEEIEEIKAAIDDEDGLDNKQIKRATDIQKAMAPQSDPGDGGEDGAEESILPREIRKMRHMFGEEINALFDLLDWEFKSKTGKSLNRYGLGRW